MRLNRHLIGSLAAAAILAPSLVSADAPATKWYDKISISGYAEGYYQLYLNQPSSYNQAAGDRSLNNFGAYTGNGGFPANYTQVPYRAFDTQANSFQYNTEMVLKYNDDASKTGATIDFIYGPKANVLNLANDNAQYNWNWSNYDSNYAVAQAYLNQAFGPVSLTLGKFATPLGYETWDSTANANYSRGLLFTQKPLYSLGAKLDYAAPWGITASVWGDNGNSIDYSQSDAKNWGVELAYAGMKNLNLGLLWYRDEAASVVGNNLANQSLFPTDTIDFTGTYTISDSLTVGAEYLHKEVMHLNPNNLSTITSPVSQGYALYTTYSIVGINISPRFEQWFTPNGNGNSQVGGLTPTYELTDYTLTLKYPMGPLTHTLEYRADASNAYEFYSNGNNSMNPTQLDQTVTYAAIYSF